MNMIICIDILTILVCIYGFYITFKLWCLMGKTGMITWLLWAMLYAVGLRCLSLFADMESVNFKLLEYTRSYAIPLYIFLVMGVWGIYKQVNKKFHGNGKKK